MSKEWLRADPANGSGVGVDRKNRVILGYVVAQRGPFKSEGRGEFDDKSLKQIISLMKAAPSGLKSRFTHPTLSSDGLGKFLGRAKNPRLDGDRVRADLYLDDSAFNTPHGDLGTYVMDLAESDPDALSSSLVLTTDKEVRLNKDGTRATNEQGKELPPLWRPTKLHASDVVDTGDAVDGFLSVEGLPDAAVRQATELLDSEFSGKSSDEIRKLCLGWLDRYLSMRFDDADDSTQLASAPIAVLRRKLDLHEKN